MKDHYRLSSKEFDSLIKSGVKISHFFKSIPLFDPYKTGAEIGFVGLLYYLDNKKQIEDGIPVPHRLIARAVFNMLCIKDKIQVAEYEELVKNDYKEIDL